jgi:nicotinamide mononucleotide transporter PnuC
MQKYYGEAILYLTIMLPMYIYGCFHWLMNRDKNKRDIVLIRENLSKKEWLISSFCFILLSIVIFFVLKSLNTSQLVVNTLSFVTMLPAVYLLARRYKWNHIAFLLNDFIVPLLWVFLVIEGKKEFVSMCIYHIFQISYDIYGLIEWVKLEKKQKSLMKNDNKMNEDKIQKNIVGKCL